MADAHGRFNVGRQHASAANEKELPKMHKAIVVDDGL